MSSSTRLEDLLPAAAAHEPGGPEGAREVQTRLNFLARVLRHAPQATGGRALLLWLDARGEVACASVGPRGVAIGRDAACEVVLASPRVSRRHGAVRWVAGGRAAGEGNGEVVIVDLDSSNGTRVNGRAIPAQRAQVLHDGDVVEAGGVALAVVVAVE